MPSPLPRLVRILVLVLLAALLAPAAGCTATGGPSARVDELLGSGAAARMLTHPGPETVVQAYRIDGMAFMEGRAEGAKETIHGYPVLAGPVAVDAASVRTLADVLGSDDTYLWDVAKGCEFLPGVAVRWQQDATTVDVLFCFSCDELEVVVDGRKVGHEDFDPRRPDLVRVAQHLFPDDEKIRALR